MKIFIYFPNWLGDAAMAIAALNLLEQNFQNAELVIYANAGALALCEGYGRLIKEDKKHRFKQFFSLRRAEKFDLVINFKASFSSRFLCTILRTKKRLFFKPQKSLQIHQTAKYARLLNALDIDTSALLDYAPARYFFIKSALSAPQKQPPKIAELFSENFRANASEKLNALCANKFRRLKARGFLGIACGAAYGGAKCYEDFTALARLLAPHFRGILLFGAKAEAASAQQIEAELSGEFAVKNLCSKTSIKRLHAALCNCDLVLANDSGIMHLCAMAQVPCAVVFGATNAAQTAAYSSSAMIFSTLASCSPCKKRECDQNEHGCMKNCPPEALAPLILRHLGRN